MIKLSFISLFLLLIPLLPLPAQDDWKEYVTVYDDFDEGQFGRSEYRDILRSVSLDNFRLTRTLSIELPDNEPFNGHLTAVTLDSEIVEMLESGEIPLERRTEDGRILYVFNYNGINFTFSVERPPSEVLDVVRAHYQNDDQWREPVLSHYRERYLIRIHSAENIFEPWIEEITYNEALLMATLIGDRSQWLWGIHDANDLLRRIYLNQDISKPDVFERF